MSTKRFAPSFSNEYKYGFSNKVRKTVYFFWDIKKEFWKLTLIGHSNCRRSRRKQCVMQFNELVWIDCKTRTKSCGKVSKLDEINKRQNTVYSQRDPAHYKKKNVKFEE